MKTLQNLKNSQKGSTLVAVMAAVVFIGIVTTFMTSMTQSGSRSTSAFNAVQAASVTSTNALRIAEEFLNKKSGDALVTITEVLDNGEQRELHSGTLGEGQNYTINVKSFNPMNNFLEVEAIGRGRGGAEKITVGQYVLGNVEANWPQGNFRNAIYLKGELSAHHYLNVQGDVFFDNVGHITGDNQPHIFHENFHWKADNGYADHLLEIRGNAFFDVENLTIGSQSTGAIGGSDFHGMTAFQNRFTTRSHQNFHDVAIFNGGVGTLGGERTFNMNSGTYEHTGDLDNIVVNDASGVTTRNPALTREQIGERLGMDIDPQPEPSIDFDAIINSGKVRDWSEWGSYNPPGLLRGRQSGGYRSGWSGGDLQKVYEQVKQEDGLWKGEYLVLNVNQSRSMTNDTNHADHVFQGKVIFLIDDNTMDFSNNVYHSGPNSTTLIYAKNGSTGTRVNNFGTHGNNEFRGLIHAESGKVSTGPLNMQGAIHLMNDDTELHLSGGEDDGAVNVTFNRDILNDLNRLPGLFSDPSQGGGNDDPPSLSLPQGEDMNAIPVSVYQY